MSTIKQRADQEADEAEAEDLEPDELEAQDDDAPDLGPEPEPEPEPSSEAHVERIGRDLDREAERHAKAVTKIMGADMGDLVPCPLCMTPGYVLVQAPPDIDPMQRQAVMIALGETPEPDFKRAANTEACPDCDGLGQVTTGSRAPAFLVKACDSCGAQGWRVVVSQLPWQPPAPDAAYPGASIAYIPAPDGAPDAWSRPPGHPHYGLPPSQVGAA